MKVVVPEELCFKKIQPKNAPPRARRYQTSVLYQEKMYVFGGSFGSKVVTDEFLCFDFQKSEWETVNSKGENKPPGRYGHSSFLFDNKMYVFAGSQGNNEGMSDLWSFDFQTSTWTQLNPPSDSSSSSSSWPLGRYLHSSVFDERTQSLYIFGGSINFRKQRDDFWILSVPTLTWKQIEKPNKEQQQEEVWPEVRAGHVSFLVEDDLYVFGGYTGDGGYSSLSDFFQVKIPTDVTSSTFSYQWKKIELEGEGQSWPFTSRGGGTAVLYKGLVYTYGGYDGANKIPSRQLLTYNVETRKWAEIPTWLQFPEEAEAILNMVKGSSGEKPTPRYGHSSILNLKTGQFTVFAGSGSTYLNDILQFELDDDEQEEKDEQEN